MGRFLPIAITVSGAALLAASFVIGIRKVQKEVEHADVYKRINEVTAIQIKEGLAAMPEVKVSDIRWESYGILLVDLEFRANKAGVPMHERVDAGLPTLDGRKADSRRPIRLGPVPEGQSKTYTVRFTSVRPAAKAILRLEVSSDGPFSVEKPDDPTPCDDTAACQQLRVVPVKDYPFTIALPKWPPDELPPAVFLPPR